MTMTDVTIQRLLLCFYYLSISGTWESTNRGVNGRHAREGPQDGGKPPTRCRPKGVWVGNSLIGWLLAPTDRVATATHSIPFWLFQEHEHEQMVPWHAPS